MTQEKILRVALQCFTENGYDGTSMEDIASGVGIRKSSLYAHYRGKEAIFAAVFEDITREYEEMIGVWTQRDPKQSAVACLGELFEAFILYCHGNLKMYFWDRYFYYPPAFLKDVIQQRTMETQGVFVAHIHALLAEGIAEEQIREQPVQGLALAYYYLMIGISMSVKLYEHDALLGDTRAAWGAFAAGLQPIDTAAVPRQGQ